MFAKGVIPSCICKANLESFLGPRGLYTEVGCIWSAVARGVRAELCPWMYWLSLVAIVQSSRAPPLPLGQTVPQSISRLSWSISCFIAYIVHLLITPSKTVDPPSLNNSSPSLVFTAFKYPSPASYACPWRGHPTPFISWDTQLVFPIHLLSWFLFSGAGSLLLNPSLPLLHPCPERLAGPPWPRESYVRSVSQPFPPSSVFWSLFRFPLPPPPISTISRPPPVAISKTGPGAT